MYCKSTHYDGEDILLIYYLVSIRETAVEKFVSTLRKDNWYPEASVSCRWHFSECDIRILEIPALLF